MITVAVVYVLGVLIGLAVTRDRFVPRLVTAVLWPLGPLTGVVVVCGLLVVAIVLWPVPMLASAAIIGGAIYVLT